MKKIKKIFLQFFKVYSSFSGIVAKISIIFCYIFLVAVTLIIGLAVFYRYVLNEPIQWAEEIARYLLIWLSLVAASVAVKERKHINLTTVVRRLPQRISLMIEIVLYVIIVFLLTIVAKYSWLMVVTRSVRQFSPSIAISMLWVHSALPVGFCLIIFQSLFILLEDINTLFGE
jgi:TRAP-type C4-dicarboxylate transport system permease small subunit